MKDFGCEFWFLIRLENIEFKEKGNSTHNHLSRLSHMDNYCLTNRLATMTDKSAYRDQWQAFNPTHLPGL